MVKPAFSFFSYKITEIKKESDKPGFTRLSTSIKKIKVSQRLTAVEPVGGVKGGINPSPFAALSFPVSKKVPIDWWVNNESISLVGRRNPGAVSRPLGNFLHHK